MKLSDMCRLAHQMSREKGWYDQDDGKRNQGELIALMHSELSEALEAARKGNPASEKIPEFSGIEEELADVLIRIGDFCGYMGFDLEGAVSAKMGYNQNRAYRHGGKKF